MEKLKLDQIIPDKNQPRKYFAVEKMASLKNSIKLQGIVQPLIVQKLGKQYLLIDGERRYRIAVELKLKEVPVHVIEAKNDFDRLVEQFHIQEQHESWTPVEKALAIMEISKISGKGLKEICEMLSVTERMVRVYTAFAGIQNKDRFIENQINITNAEGIRDIKIFARTIKEKVLDEPFTKAQEGKLEKVLVDKIKNSEITSYGGYTRIKDSFRSNPRLVDEFLTGEYDIDTQFVHSNAAGSSYIRNMVVSASYVNSKGQAFLKNPSVKITEQDLGILRRANKTIEEVIKLAE